eukprot:scaffold155595_cov25-Prasinocladus_malaysianus.AAC.1
MAPLVPLAYDSMSFKRKRNSHTREDSVGYKSSELPIVCESRQAQLACNLLWTPKLVYSAR